MPRSMRSRLTLTHLTVAIAAVVLSAGLGSALFAARYTAQRRAELIRAATDLAELAAPHLANSDRAGLWLLTRTAGAALGGPVCVFRASELSPLASSQSGEPATGRHAGPPSGIPARAVIDTVAVECQGGLTYTVTAPVPDPRGGAAVGAVVLRCPIVDVRRIESAQWLTAGVAALGAALLAVLLACAFAARVARPLARLNAAAQRLAAGDFTVRSQPEGPAEVAGLAATLNATAAQLAGLFAALAAERGKLDDVVASMAEGVVVCDAEERVTLANQEACRLLGVPPPAGRLLADWVADEAVRAALRGGTGDSPVGAAGHALQVRTAPLSAGEGSVAVVVDVTEAERLDRMRREFVANASHQLRTPLTSIRGYLEAVADGTAAAPEQQARCMAVALDQVGLLQGLVNQLLQLSRLQAGEMAEPPAPVRLDEVAERAVEHLRPQAAARGVRLALRRTGEDTTVLGHGDLLVQAVGNLLDNAIRHSPSGAEVGLAVNPCGGEVELVVSDRGPGFEPAEAQALWERFHTGRAGQGGTGLGLPIAREVVSLHGGEVFAESPAEGGARFGFRIPAA